MRRPPTFTITGPQGGSRIRAAADRLDARRMREPDRVEEGLRPKSPEWLLATVTTSRPPATCALRSSAGEPRKWNSLFATASPRVETAPSRFAVARSAARSVRPTRAHG